MNAPLEKTSRVGERVEFLQGKSVRVRVSYAEILELP